MGKDRLRSEGHLSTREHQQLEGVTLQPMSPDSLSTFKRGLGSTEFVASFSKCDAASFIQNGSWPWMVNNKPQTPSRVRECTRSYTNNFDMIYESEQKKFWGRHASKLHTWSSPQWSSHPPSALRSQLRKQKGAVTIFKMQQTAWIIEEAQSKIRGNPG